MLQNVRKIDICKTQLISSLMAQQNSSYSRSSEQAFLWLRLLKSQLHVVIVATVKEEDMVILSVVLKRGKKNKKQELRTNLEDMFLP